MTNKLLSGLTVMAAAGLLASCGDTFDPHGDGRKGRINADFGLDTEVVTSATSGLSKIKSRAAREIQVNDLALTLTSADGQMSKHWDSVGDFPTGSSWAVGDYVMEASYGSADDEGFDKPYYYGKTELTVRDSQPTTVALTAQLANSMVTVTFSDAFKSYFAGFEASLLTETGGTIAYPADATAPCYVKAGAVTLQVKVKKNSGTEAVLTPKSFTAEARHHYKLALDVNGGNTGEGQLVLKFDDMLDIEDEEIDLSDQLLNAPAPQLTATGFTSGEPVEFIAGTAKADAKKLTIIAQGGISSIVMRTTSTSLAEQGWPAEADLAAGNTAQLDMLKNLGLTTIGLSKGADKMAVLDLTGVLNHIEYIPGADNVTEITFEVRDRYSKVSEPVTMKLVVNELVMTLSDPEAFYDEDTQASFTMTYNGGSIDDVKIQMRNERGTWSDIDATFALKSRAAQAYTVTATVPATGAVTLRALRGNMASNVLTIERTQSPYALKADARDFFAYRGEVSLIDNPAYQPVAAKRSRAAADVTNATLQISADGGKTYFTPTAQHAGQAWTLSELTPGTTYLAKATVDGIPTRPVEFSTEALLQISNGNLDADVSINGSGSNWQNVVFQGWGTNNPMTTWFSDNPLASDYAYDKISGTIQTDDAHSGKAALIRTVGWGRGNTATSSNGTSGTCKYLDAGLLHLGDSRTGRPGNYSDRPGPLNTDDLECGVAFASRPSSISFWYKYSAKHADDRGVVLVWVKDSEGNIIASAERELSAYDSYTKQTLDLNYGADASKCAKLYIRFMSTNKQNAVNRTSGWLTGPGFMGQGGRGTYMGSQLYIDDITLNY